jgi:hypothetical protein
MAERIYLKFNYPGAVFGSKTLLTGIRGTGNGNIVNDTLYISGFYTSPDGAITSFLYKGDLTGRDGSCNDINSRNNWHVLGYPSAPGRSVIATSLYGPAILKHGNVRVVGNYTTEESNGSAFGCMYEGPLDGSGIWTTLVPQFGTDPTLNVIAHSTHGDLVVGNYDTELYQGKAFIYDIRTGTYYDISKPKQCPSKVGIKSITAYGVWHNDGANYTICGGFTRLDPSTGLDSAYLIDWNNKTHTFSNWRSYNYNNDNKTAAVTHFDGITTDGHDGYNLTGDAILLNENKEIAFFSHIGCNDDAHWAQIKYPGSVSTSGNSVYKSAVIGVYQIDHIPTVNGYISIRI